MRVWLLILAIVMAGCGKRTYLVVRSTAKVELGATYSGGAVKPVRRFRKDDGAIRIPCDGSYRVDQNWMGTGTDLPKLAEWIRMLRSPETLINKEATIEVACVWTRAASKFVGSTPAPGGRYDWYEIGAPKEYENTLRTPISNIVRVKRAKRTGRGLGWLGMVAGGASTIMSGIVYAFPNCDPGVPDECEDVRGSYAPWLITSIVVTGLGVVSFLLDWETAQSLD